MYVRECLFILPSALYIAIHLQTGPHCDTVPPYLFRNDYYSDPLIAMKSSFANVIQKSTRIFERPKKYLIDLLTQKNTERVTFNPKITSDPPSRILRVPPPPIPFPGVSLPPRNKISWFQTPAQSSVQHL